jgi:hypothetical protein
MQTGLGASIRASPAQESRKSPRQPVNGLRLDGAASLDGQANFDPVNHFLGRSRD